MEQSRAYIGKQSKETISTSCVFVSVEIHLNLFKNLFKSI